MFAYHYTKAIAMNGILTDGFIATEKKRGITNVNKHTDFVWLTEKTRYPKTALPLIGHLPYTNLSIHIAQPNTSIDFETLSTFCGGLYRLGFEKADTRIKKWWYSDERKEAIKIEQFRRMETIANKVGDEVRSFWIAQNDLELSNFSLEVYKNNGWAKLLTNCSVSSLTTAQASVIDQLKLNSLEIIKKYS